MSVSFQTSMLAIILGMLPVCAFAVTVAPVSVDLEIIVEGGRDQANPPPDPILKEQSTGTGEDPLPLSSSLDYYTDRFGGYGYGNAEVFYDSPERFGASVGFDLVEGNCTDGCSIEGRGTIEFELEKTSVSQTEIPFTISAADLFVSGHQNTFAEYYIDLQATDGGNEIIGAGFFEHAILDSTSNFTLDRSEGFGGDIVVEITGAFDTNATIGRQLRTEAEGFPFTWPGASFVADTYSGSLDISSFDVGDTIDLYYDWAVGVGAELSSASAYAVFQDPLGPVNLDLSAFGAVSSDPIIPAPNPPGVSPVPLPAGFLLLLSGLLPLWLGARRRRSAAA